MKILGCSLWMKFAFILRALTRSVFPLTWSDEKKRCFCYFRTWNLFQIQDPKKHGSHLLLLLSSSLCSQGLSWPFPLFFPSSSSTSLIHAALLLWLTGLSQTFLHNLMVFSVSGNSGPIPADLPVTLGNIPLLLTLKLTFLYSLLLLHIFFFCWGWKDALP